jgi:DUF971 family protein
LTNVMPKKIKRVSPTQTDIEWNDGHLSSYPSWYLRENCPCAESVDEFTGERRLVPGSIPAALERTNVELVGNYALQFEWSDGHGMGLYAYRFLRELCPCSECRPEGLQPPRRTETTGSFEV